MIKVIRKADWVLFAVLLAAALLMLMFLFTGGERGENVVISVDSETYGTYPLNENREIRIDRNGHENVVAIEDGTVYMKSADCKNQNCVEQGTISQTNESIVCLPNRVVVRIEGGDSNEYDVIAK